MRSVFPLPHPLRSCIHLTNLHKSQSTFQNDVMAKASRSRFDPSTPAASAGAERLLPPTLETSSPTQIFFVLAANSNPQRRWRRRREIVAVGNLWLAAVIVLFCVAPLPLHSQGSSGSIGFFLCYPLSLNSIVTPRLYHSQASSSLWSCHKNHNIRKSIEPSADQLQLWFQPTLHVQICGISQDPKQPRGRHGHFTLCLLSGSVWHIHH